MLIDVAVSLLSVQPEAAKKEEAVVKKPLVEKKGVGFSHLAVFRALLKVFCSGDPRLAS